MPETKSLKGVTVNGIPLDSYLGEINDKKIESEVMDIVRASKYQHIYHASGIKCKKPKRERNGPVNTISNIEIHQKNKEGYIKQMLKTNNIKGCIVGALLSANKPLTAFDIKKVIDAQCESDPVKSAQIRVFMGQINKSELNEDIERSYPSGRTRGAAYFLTDNAKLRHSLESANVAANTQVSTRSQRIKPRTIPKEPEKKQNIEFVLTDTNELPVLKVEGSIDVNVHFHFHWGSK